MSMQITPPSRATVEQLFKKPLLDLVYQAAGVHREHHAPDEVHAVLRYEKEPCGRCHQERVCEKTFKFYVKEMREEENGPLLFSQPKVETILTFTEKVEAQE